MGAMIQNSVLKRILSELIHAGNPSLVPFAITDYTVPTLLANDGVYYADDSFAESASAINATSATILTTDSIKDTYLTSATLGVIKDVTSTSVLSAITVVINGQSKNILSIPGITLTVQSEVTSVSFPTPLKLDRSSTVTVTNSTNVANIKATGSITGFLRLRN